MPGNPLLAAQGPPPAQMPQAGPQMAPGAPPAQSGPMFTGADGSAATADQIAKAHQQADLMLEELSGLVKKPPGQLSKQDVFQGAASLLGKGLFNDPQQRMGLVAGLTKLPDDETALRQALGAQIGQLIQLKGHLDAHSAQMGGG